MKRLKRLLAIKHVIADIKAGVGEKDELIARAKARGELGAIDVETIVSILIVAGLLVPIGMDFINTASTGSWTAQQVLAWGAIGTLAIVAIVLIFLRQGGFSKSN